MNWDIEIWGWGWKRQRGERENKYNQDLVSLLPELLCEFCEMPCLRSTGRRLLQRPGPVGLPQMLQMQIVQILVPVEMLTK